MKNVHIKDICIKGSSALKQKDLLTEGKFPVYGAGGIVGYLDTFHQEKTYIGIIKDGSGIGRVDFYPEKTSLIGTLQYILPRTGYDIRYIGYCLQSLDLSKYKQGAAIPHIYFRDYGERIVNVTEDVKEQQAIVSRLDSAFAKVDAVKANAEKQLNDAKALFQKELSKAMTPKEGWERKKLGEVGTFSRGINFLKSDFVKDGYPCIHYGQIHTKLGHVTYKHLTCIPEEKVKKEKVASKGDLIIAITSEDVEASCKCTAWMGDYEIAVGAHAAIFKHSLNPIYVSYYFRSPLFQKEKEKYTHGFKVVEIKPSDIAKIPISIPPLSEQQAIVTHLDTLSEKLKTVEEKQKAIVAECDAMKQALLREVFETPPRPSQGEGES